MRRWAAATAVLALMTTGISATAGASASRAPTIVRPGQTWIFGDGDFCETDSFTLHGAFSGTTDDGAAVQGTYTKAHDGTRVTMTWTAGPAPGAVFAGRLRRDPRDYRGSYADAGPSVGAGLGPASDGACPAVSAAPRSTSVSLGTADTDTVTVTGAGGVTPTGVVYFFVCPGDSGPCDPNSATAVSLGATDLSGSGYTAVATGPAFAPTATGAYCFWAGYSGSRQYVPVAEMATTDQCFTVTPIDPDLTTAPASTSIVLGASDTDAATLTTVPGFVPTGSISFYVCGPTASATACTSTVGTELGEPVPARPITDVTAIAASYSYTPATPGIYCFLAVYSGDLDYTPSSDGSTSGECFTVVVPGPGLTTQAQSTSIALGASETDTATLTGENDVTPTGDIHFYACPEASLTGRCTPGAEGADDLGTVPVVGSGDTVTATSTPFTPTSTGDFCFAAVYPGDANDPPETDTSTTSECFIVGPADQVGPPVGIMALNKVGPHEVLSGGTGRFVVAGDLFLNTDVFDQPWSTSDGTDEWDDAIDAKVDSNLSVYGTIRSSSALGSGRYANEPLWPLDACFLPEGRQAGGPGGPTYPTTESPTVQMSCTENGDSANIDYNALQNTWLQIDDPLQGSGAPPSPVGNTAGCPGMAQETFGPVTQVPGTVTQLMPGTYTSPVDLTGDAVLNDCPGGFPGIYNFDAGLAIDPQAGASVTGTDVVIATQSPYPMAGNVPGSLVGGVFVATPDADGNGAPCLPLSTMTSPASGNGTPMPEATSAAPCGGTNPTTYGVTAYRDSTFTPDPEESGTGDNYSLVIGGAGSVSLTGPTSGVYGGTDGSPGIVVYQDPATQANYGFDAEAGDSADIQINGVVYNASLANYGADAPLDYWDGTGGGVPFYAGGSVQAGDGTGWSNGPPESAGSVTVNGSAFVDDFDTDGATTLTILGQPYPPPAGTAATAAPMISADRVGPGRVGADRRGSAHGRAKGTRRLSRHRGGRRGRGGSR